MRDNHKAPGSVRAGGRGLLQTNRFHLRSFSFLARHFRASSSSPIGFAGSGLAARGEGHARSAASMQTSQSAASKSAPSAAAAAPSTPAGGISNTPPSIPVDQIIKQFAAHEAEFKTERDNFTYTQTFSVQTLDDAGHPDGEYKMTSDITYSQDGRRNENVTYAPQSTLERIMLSPQGILPISRTSSHSFAHCGQVAQSYNADLCRAAVRLTRSEHMSSM